MSFAPRRRPRKLKVRTHHRRKKLRSVGSIVTCTKATAKIPAEVECRNDTASNTRHVLMSAIDQLMKALSHLRDTDRRSVKMLSGTVSLAA